MEPENDGVESLSEVADSPSVESALDAVKEFLGFDVTYATEMADGEQHFRVLRGDGASFGVQQGTVMPEDQTYCRKVLDGKLPQVITDVAADPEAAILPVTDAAGVGAFVSVPLHFSDGSFFGTLCAASHERAPDLGDRELRFLRVFARIVADQFEREIIERKSRNLEVQAASADTLLAAVAARDAYTAAHSEEVVELSRQVAERLELSEREVEEVALVALLHDIGKISTPDSILQKPGPLDPQEWEIMRNHPVEGETLVRAIPHLAQPAPMVRAEHERWDGNGYPDGLAGHDIPLASRIILACDAYSAMITDRPYRKAMDEESARSELTANAGSQFDPEVVEALLEELARD